MLVGSVILEGAPSPNPLVSSSTINYSFTGNSNADVQLAIMNNMGKWVRNLAIGNRAPEIIPSRSMGRPQTDRHCRMGLTHTKYRSALRTLRLSAALSGSIDRKILRSLPYL